MTADFACLAVETATEVCSIAVCNGDRINVREFASSREGSAQVYESVREAMKVCDLDFEALDCIAFGCGPGSFTGLRVGAAVVQALAFAADIPVCRISSLATLAAGSIRKSQASIVAACLDARMNEAYLALYATDDRELIRVEMEDRLVDPQEFAFRSQQQFFAVGSGWRAYPALSDRHAAQIEGADFEMLPSAADLLTLARHRFRSGQTVSAAEALPNYVREKVVQ